MNKINEATFLSKSEKRQIFIWPYIYTFEPQSMKTSLNDEVVKI